jgi:hypothetical protein
MGYPPVLNVVCLWLERVVKSTKTTSEINANKSKSRPVMALALNCVFYKDI